LPKLKLFFSIYNTGFDKELDKNFGNKAILDGVDLEDVAELSKPSSNEVYKFAAKWSDGIIIGSEGINPDLDKEIRAMKKPTLDFQNEESYIEEYNNFYDSVLSDGEPD
jgi:starch synthase